MITKNKSLIVIVFLALVAFYFVFRQASNVRIYNKNKADTVQTLTPQSAMQHMEDEPGIIIDVRTEEEYNAGHLAEADYQYDLLSGEFEAMADGLDKNRTYYLYCRSGNRSGQAAKILKEKGFTRVFNIGGFPDLERAGFEVE